MSRGILLSSGVNKAKLAASLSSLPLSRECPRVSGKMDSRLRGNDGPAVSLFPASWAQSQSAPAIILKPTQSAAHSRSILPVIQQLFLLAYPCKPLHVSHRQALP